MNTPEIGNRVVTPFPFPQKTRVLNPKKSTRRQSPVHSPKVLAMALEMKFVWKQMAPVLDPFTIAAASMSNRSVRRWCVSPNGLLVVPIVKVDCDPKAEDAR